MKFEYMNGENLKSATVIFNDAYIKLNSVFRDGLRDADNRKLAQIIPSTIMLSFAIEIDLKYLNYRESGDPRWGHDLKNLCKSLQEETQHRIKTNVISDLGINKNEFDSKMDEVKDAFQSWRYFFEGDRKMDYKFLRTLYKYIHQEI